MFAMEILEDPRHIVLDASMARGEKVVENVAHYNL